MTAKSALAFRGSAIAFFGAGVVFLANDNPALGLGLFLVGIAFMVRSTKEGSSIAQERPWFVALDPGRSGPDCGDHCRDLFAAEVLVKSPAQ